MKNTDYTKIDFTAKNKPRKRSIQTLFYMMSKVKGNVTMLCGPALLEHIQDALLILVGFGKIRIYEQCKKVYNKNIKDLKTIKYSNKVNIYNDDIINAKPDRFMDLDYCSKLVNNIGEIQYFYKKMSQIKGKKGDLWKHLLITFPLRNSPLEMNLDALCTIFKVRNSFRKVNLLPKIKLMEGVSSNDNLIYNYATYRDGTPMCTFSIQWK